MIAAEVKDGSRVGPFVVVVSRFYAHTRVDYNHVTRRARFRQGYWRASQSRSQNYVQLKYLSPPGGVYRAFR